MADDGTGLVITIPSIFLSKSYGLQVIKHLMLAEHWPKDDGNSTSSSASREGGEREEGEREVRGEPVRVIIDVTARVPPQRVSATGRQQHEGGESSSFGAALPLEFSLESLRHVGILPEHIIHQIANGLTNGKVKDIALEVKTSTMHDEEQAMLLEMEGKDMND